MTAVYVDGLGSDYNSGTLDAPVKTVQQANTLSAMDSGVEYIIVLPGDYPEHVEPMRGNVTYLGVGYPRVAGFDIRGQTGVTIIGFEIGVQ